MNSLLTEAVTALRSAALGAKSASVISYYFLHPRVKKLAVLFLFFFLNSAHSLHNLKTFDINFVPQLQTVAPLQAALLRLRLHAETHSSEAASRL